MIRRGKEEKEHCTNDLVSTCPMLAASNGLRGKIPEELKALSRLEILDLNMNGLSGSLPSFENSFEELQHFSVAGNLLSGTIPDYSQMTKITTLDLASNSFTSTIPGAMIQAMPDLRELYLQENGLTGIIPSELGTSLQLESFDISENEFTGTVPSSIVQLPNLSLFNLDNNELDGDFPFSFITSPLNRLQGGHNRFTGSINWKAIGKLGGTLEHLVFPDNELGGSIGPSVGALTSLRFFDLNRNQLEGQVPTSIGLLQPLKWLALNRNFFSGTLPSEMGNLGELAVLTVDFNSFTGQVPSSLGNLRWLGK